MDFDPNDIPELPPALTVENYRPKSQLKAHHQPAKRTSSVDSLAERTPLSPSRASNNQHSSGLHLDDAEKDSRLGMDMDESVKPITLDDILEKSATDKKQENPKAKRLARDVAKLDAERLLGPEGLPALVKIAKGMQLQGKKHEFEDLQHIMLQYQKWSHRVFSKVVFTSFIETAEKVCRERRVKIWKDALLSEEYRRARGYGNQDIEDEVDEDYMNNEVDQSALQNQIPLQHALNTIDDLNREEEEELARMMVDAESEIRNSTSAYPITDKFDDDFDFDAQIREQLGVPNIPKLIFESQHQETSQEDSDENIDRLIAEAQAEGEFMHLEPDFDISDPSSSTMSPKCVNPIIDPSDKFLPVSNSERGATAMETNLSATKINDSNETMLPSQLELEEIVGQFDWDSDDQL